jgi:hypothetical protein
MSYLGDYTEDYTTLNFKFTTRDGTGLPTTLAGIPVLSVYKGNDVAQSTVGITLTVDFDTVTGLNNVLIDLSSNAFYAIGQDYSVVVTTGTVDGISVVGEVVATFSIENRFEGAADALVAIKLDHLVAVADSDDVADNSIIAKLASVTGDWSLYGDGTDSLQAIRDKLPTNLEDLNITNTTGLVRPDMANASGNYPGTVATITTYTGNTPQTGDLYLIGKSAGDGDLEAILDQLTTGVNLAATGLDLIPVTDPAAVADTFPKMLVQLWRRFFRKTTLTATTLTTYQDDDTTGETVQTVSDDETTQTQGTAT